MGEQNLHSSALPWCLSPAVPRKNMKVDKLESLLELRAHLRSEFINTVVKMSAL